MKLIYLVEVSLTLIHIFDCVFFMFLFFLPITVSIWTPMLAILGEGSILCTHKGSSQQVILEFRIVQIMVVLIEVDEDGEDMLN